MIGSVTVADPGSSASEEIVRFRSLLLKFCNAETELLENVTLLVLLVVFDFADSERKSGKANRPPVSGGEFDTVCGVRAVVVVVGVVINGPPSPPLIVETDDLRRAEDDAVCLSETDGRFGVSLGNVGKGFGMDKAGTCLP